jgi:hypothetical protein
MSSTNATITDIELIKSYVRNKFAGDTQTQATSIKGDEADDAATEVRQKALGNQLRHRKLRKADLEMFSKTQTLSTASILQ